MTELDRRTLLRAGFAAGAALAVPTVGRAPSASAQAPALVRRDRPVLTHGVQSGDVTARTATVWSRADRPSRLLVEVSPDPSFRRSRTLRGPVVTPDSDGTGRLLLRGLRPDSEVHYRVRAVDLDGRAASAPVAGSLRTAPQSRRDVRFCWSGDIAGQGWGVNEEYGGFRAAAALRDLDPDFFLCSGDTVYADGPLAEQVTLPDGRVWRNVVTPEKSKVAETLDEFRGQYKYNLLAENWRDFLAHTPQVNQWDDHEVINNWYPGEILEDARYTEKRVDVLAARAGQAFREYVPIEGRRGDASGRIYRVVPYGPLVDVFVLDMRTHKDPNGANDSTVPADGVLGREQTDWLKRELRRSRAVWKVIAADLPIGLVVPDGAAMEGIAQGHHGTPLGREFEVAEILTFLKRQGIRNHVWLTTDVHYTAAHHYAPERAAYTDFDAFWELVSGPLNAGGFGPNALDSTFGPEAVFVSTPPRPNTSPAEGHQYVGEIAVEGGSGVLTARLRGVGGEVLWSTDLAPRRR
ncbi:MAG: alkaline phosphatase D family protein [Nocardioidaceae bacterium]